MVGTVQRKTRNKLPIMQGLQAEAGKPLGRICAPGRAAEAPPPPPAAGTPPWHLCFSSRVRRTLALSSGRIWSDTIIVSTTRCAMPGRVVCSRSRRAAPGGIVREGGGTVPSDREKKNSPPAALLPKDQQMCWVSQALSVPRWTHSSMGPQPSPRGMQKGAQG